MRTFTFAYQCQTESIHYITCMVTFFSNPVHHYFLLTFNAEILDAGNYFRQLSHTFCRVFFPAFLHCLFVIFSRSHKEETTYIPQFLDKTYTVFHHADYRNDLLERSLYPMLFQHRQKQFGNFFIRFKLDILMIEPNTFFIVEFSSGLAATMNVEQFYHLVHRHHFLIVARIPSQQSQEVNHRFGQITRFTISGRHFSRFRTPFQREYRESQTVAVTLA